MDDVNEMSLSNVDLTGDTEPATAAKKEKKKETKEAKKAMPPPAPKTATRKRGAEDAGLKADGEDAVLPTAPKKHKPESSLDHKGSASEGKTEKMDTTKDKAPPTETKRSTAPPIVVVQSVAVAESEVGTKPMEDEVKPPAPPAKKPVSKPMEEIKAPAPAPAKKSVTKPLTLVPVPVPAAAPKTKASPAQPDGKATKVTPSAPPARPPARETKVAAAAGETKAPDGWKDPNEHFFASAQWFVNRFDKTDFRIDVPQEGARAGRPKLVFYDTTQKKDSKTVVTVLTPLHATYNPECRPYGDWRNPKMAKWRPNQTLPLEAQLKYQMNSWPWHSELKNLDGKDKWCIKFLDEFLPEMERRMVRACVRGADDMPGDAGSAVRGWIDMYTPRYKENASESLEDFLIRCILNGQPEQRNKTTGAVIRKVRTSPYRMVTRFAVTKATEHVKRVVFVPVHPKTKEVLTDNRRCTFSSMLCGQVYDKPHPSGKGSLGEPCPKYITDPILQKVFTAKGPKGERYKVLEQPTIDGTGADVPWEKAVIRPRDVVALMISLGGGFFEGKLSLKLTVKSRIIFERGKATNVAEQTRDVVRTAMPGAKSLDEPAPAPQYGRTGNGASSALGDDGDGDYDGDGGAPDEPGVPVPATSTGDETMQDAENLYGDEQPAPAPESTQGDEQPAAGAAMSELEQDQPLY